MDLKDQDESPQMVMFLCRKIIKTLTLTKN
jgi:hypothetical protein